VAGGTEVGVHYYAHAWVSHGNNEVFNKTGECINCQTVGEIGIIDSGFSSLSGEFMPSLSHPYLPTMSVTELALNKEIDLFDN
jgi:hypothetical protein